jgi:hypothetical protein
MRSNILVLVVAIAVAGISSHAMARGGSSGGSGSGKSSGTHVHFGHHFQRNFGHHFQRNQVFFGDGWGWGPYSGYGGDTTVLVSQQPNFPAVGVTGSISPVPCRWDEQTFTVPSSGGGTRPVQVMSCR